MTRLAPHEIEANLARERWDKSDGMDDGWKLATYRWVQKYGFRTFRDRGAQIEYLSRAVYAATQRARETGRDEMRALYEEAIKRAGVYDEVAAAAAEINAERDVRKKELVRAGVSPPE